jgi:hypothetical protein
LVIYYLLIKDDGWERMLKEMVMAYLKVISLWPLGVIEADYKNLQSG